MDIPEFFLQLKAHYKQELPFVAYRKPKETKIQGRLQSNKDLFTTNGFSESGFIFAPFDSEKPAILFPIERSETISVEIDLSQLVVELNESLPNHTIEKPTDSFAEDKKAHHLRLVSEGISLINSSKLKKVVLSRKEIVEIAQADIFGIFKKLILKYPEAFAYLWFHPKVGLWMGATPETFFNIKGSRFKTMSLAGTMPAKGNPDAIWDQKNLVEQQMVTTYIENELKPIVNDLLVSPQETVKAGELLHIKSDISGNVVFDEHLNKRLIDALHPTPAVCGFPKLDAKQFILENENYNRQYYTGFLGELNLKNQRTRNTNRRNVENSAYGSFRLESDLFVNLRCMQIIKNEAHIYVGGGVTKDSTPEKEWEETTNKAATMLDVLDS